MLKEVKCLNDTLAYFAFEINLVKKKKKSSPFPKGLLSGTNFTSTLQRKLDHSIGETK